MSATRGSLHCCSIVQVEASACFPSSNQGLARLQRHGVMAHSACPMLPPYATAGPSKAPGAPCARVRTDISEARSTGCSCSQLPCTCCLYGCDAFIEAASAAEGINDSSAAMTSAQRTAHNGKLSNLPTYSRGTRSQDMQGVKHMISGKVHHRHELEIQQGCSVLKYTLHLSRSQHATCWALLVGEQMLGHQPEASHQNPPVQQVWQARYLEPVSECSTAAAAWTAVWHDTRSGAAATYPQRLTCIRLRHQPCW